MITTNDVVAFEFDGEDSQGRIQGHYRSSGVRPGFQSRLDYFGLGKAWGAAVTEA
jgi:pilus assembly protein CpaF